MYDPDDPSIGKPTIWPEDRPHPIEVSEDSPEAWEMDVWRNASSRPCTLELYVVHARPNSQTGPLGAPLLSPPVMRRYVFAPGEEKRVPSRYRNMIRKEKHGIIYASACPQLVRKGDETLRLHPAYAVVRQANGNPMRADGTRLSTGLQPTPDADSRLMIRALKGAGAP